MSNGLKFTPRGGQVRIKVAYKKMGDLAKLSIKVIDTGIGISEEDQQKLLKMFGMLD